MSNTLNLGTNGNWATKKESLLAYNDENNNFKPLPFNFTRNSSATIVNKEGLIEVVSNNEPRIDFKDSSEGSLLLEPSRSNLITYSEDYTDNSWSKTGLTVSSNQIISPDGTLNADEVNITTANAYFLFNTISVSELTDYTFTFYAKKGTATDVAYSILNGVNFTNIVNTTSYFNEISDTDWTRIIIEFTTPLGCNSIRTYPLRDGSSTGTVYIWGAQLEQGSYATSYIPTQGSIGTRVAESCGQNPVSGIIGQTELTVFYKGIVERLGGSDGHAIALSQSADAAGSSRILLYRNSYGDMYVYVQDTTTVFSTPLLVNSNPQINDKYAIAIKDNDLVIYCNGVKVAENNSGTIPTMQYIYLNEWSNQINQKNITQEVKLYNTRLSNTELQQLTS